MKRVLFVDDEPRILQGLENLLRPRRKYWEAVFAHSGAQAMELLSAGTFDVVVSDMRMPHMDGVALLGQVMKLYPRTIRIVLSGHTEMETALKTVSVAHQFLAKPCSATQLLDVLERACSLNDLLTDDRLRGVAGRIGHLPSVPAVYRSLTAALTNPDVSLKQISGLIEGDIAMSAKVLQLVNSAFFGLPRRVASVFEAVTYIGTIMVRNVVLATETFGAFQGATLVPGFSVEALHGHAIRVAEIARLLLPDKRHSENVFIAGMLHDIGKLILGTQLPDQWTASMGDFTRPMHENEEEQGLVSHTRLGAYLLGLWGLPYPIIEAVAHHHRPMNLSHEGFDLPDVLYVADWLERDSCDQATKETQPPLDLAYLMTRGVDAARLDGWKKAVRQNVAGAAS